ncbi:hypothetical protein FA10DRAFT_266382 [Acaromyces ingoldii]|uniref:RNase H type-1 domain-containing protein n=1 Tax=Acaromyces ingoldii TaxID=215250 RepID=A0A316YLZ9_9BASI|nr:hypothetical protein FA10DRAFT_266382 [Acaromyces ingoldii]PWN89834.1 hypothetical protein FA10DRAFT_266382 [Acaromyces ingoldii]
MTTTLSERSSMPDAHHRCLGYPLTILVASDAINVGSLIAPSIVGAYTIHHGRGHPLNKTKIFYPDTPGYLPDDADYPPTQALIQRRTLLLGAIEALTAIKEQYLDPKRNVCVHICCTSRYLPQVWLKWIPEWTENGWPGEVQTRPRRASNATAKKAGDNRLSRRESRMSVLSDGRASVMSGGGESIFSHPESLGSTGLFDQRTGKPMDDALIRQLVDLHAHFEHAMAERRGTCSVTVVRRQGNIAAETAKDAVALASSSSLIRPSVSRPSHSRLNSNATTLVGGYPRRNSLGSSAGTGGTKVVNGADAATTKTLPRSFSKPPYPAPAVPGLDKNGEADVGRGRAPVLPAIIPFRSLERSLSTDTAVTGEDTYEDAIDRIDEEEETPAKAAPALVPVVSPSSAAKGAEKSPSAAAAAVKPSKRTSSIKSPVPAEKPLRSPKEEEQDAYVIPRDFQAKTKSGKPKALPKEPKQAPAKDKTQTKTKQDPLTAYRAPKKSSSSLFSRSRSFAKMPNNEDDQVEIATADKLADDPAATKKKKTFFQRLLELP